MGFMDEIKKLTHPYSDQEDDYDDYGYKYKLNAFSATVGIVF